MNSHTRVGYSASTASVGSVTFWLGPGDWEIEALSVIMGSNIPSLNGMEVGEGYVAFESLAADETTVEQKHYLLVGRCTRAHPLIMFGGRRVKGPGQIKSYLNHGNDSTYDHTMIATYRKVLV